MMALFTASSIQSAFVELSADLGVSVQRTSYLVSIVIAVLGGAPLLWRPISHTYGRRPVFLATLLCSLVGNVGCAVSHSYGTMGLCRAITAFFISPAMAFGTAVVQETFFRQERARFMGVWSSMLTLGVPVAPLIFGFVAERVSYRWIFWTLAITNGVQFILHALLGPETRFEPASDVPLERTSRFRREYLSFRRIDQTPLRLATFLSPLRLVTYPNVILPAAAYSMVFLWGSVMTTFEIPQIFPEKFGFGPEKVGLQYIGIIVGTIIGEQIGGVMSDKWMLARERKGNSPRPEHRLWLSYVGYALSICGVAVFLVQIDRASDEWNVTPIIGASIAAAGNQIVTTILITYAVDCYPQEAAAIGVFITLVRQCWGFIGPFWAPDQCGCDSSSDTRSVYTAHDAVTVERTILAEQDE
ncbi:putative arabinose efflux permease, MFS family [Geosmithia morbida]|uniref:Arabinose efflux permease, MFS family n=1 Tax=Geosmithia morbida TaxID=1094350 RepID=A0A9P5D2I2_9HYPO|nr:putative arabinose efflux permease, MFS family [Geosmithia morbida]KAF4121501.1 putative arabinose efflux permease, MFS family [Geosmithia morbida]